MTHLQIFLWGLIYQTYRQAFNSVDHSCRRCSNYILILNLTPGFNGLGKDNY